jgi:hypothetical protein
LSMPIENMLWRSNNNHHVLKPNTIPRSSYLRYEPNS